MIDTSLLDRPTQVTPRTSFAFGLITFLFVVLLAVAGVRQLSLTNVAHVSAPPTEFSSAPAMKRSDATAKSPSPIGSACNSDAPDYILGTLTEMGVSPAVQKV